MIPLKIAKKNNFPLSHLIYYPEDHSLPSKEEERELMQEVGCDAILTKESGESGGFKNKVNAALELGLIEMTQPARKIIRRK